MRCSHELHRRRILSGVAVVGGLATAGCLSGGAPSSRGEQDGSEFDPDIEQRIQLGGASKSTLEIAPKDDYEYLAEEGKVRIEYDSGDTSTMSFGRYGTHQAVDHGTDRLQRLLESESMTGTGISVGRGGFEISELTTSTAEESPLSEEIKRDALLAPKVFHSHHHARDGSLISEPSISFQEIVEVIPRMMNITITFPEQQYQAVLLVVCKKGWYQNE